MENLEGEISEIHPVNLIQLIPFFFPFSLIFYFIHFWVWSLLLFWSRFLNPSEEKYAFIICFSAMPVTETPKPFQKYHALMPDRKKKDVSKLVVRRAK